MRTGRPLVTLKAALTLDGKISAPEDNTGWITSETGARACPGDPPQFRRDSHRHRHRARRRLPAHRPHRRKSAAGRCCASWPIPRFACRSNRASSLERQWRSARCHDVGRVRRTPPRARIPRRSRAGLRRAGRPHRSRTVGRWLAQGAVPVADDRIRQQAQLGGARIGRGRQSVCSITRRKFWAAFNRCR